MNFAEYVDSLAKQGIIDGNITEILISKHRAECENPYSDIKKRLSIVLDDMWQYGAADYADRIDDIITELEDGVIKQKGGYE